jgi:hypothetical protein
MAKNPEDMTLREYIERQLGAQGKTGEKILEEVADKIHKALSDPENNVIDDIVNNVRDDFQEHPDEEFMAAAKKLVAKEALKLLPQMVKSRLKDLTVTFDDNR